MRLLACSMGASISIHALLAESDAKSYLLSVVALKFLSTLSLRRATNFLIFSVSIDFYFYPRSPCGERRQKRKGPRSVNYISIHALLAESDCRTKHSTNTKNHFYPRSPCGERQRFQAADISAKRISIHALLAESDVLTLIWDVIAEIFLSTLSLRRATSL